MSSKFRQLANFISGNFSIVVSVVVNLIVTRLIIQKLGLETYGIVAFVLNISLLIIVLGNALSGTTARYLTLNYAKKNSREASIYMSNTLAIVFAGGLLVSFLLYIYIKFFSKSGKVMPIGFIEVMLLSMLASAIAGVFSSGNFVREKFIARDAINSVTRIINGLVCGLLLLYLDFGLWAVAIGTFAGSFLRLISFRYSCRILLSEVRNKVSLVSRHHIFVVTSFVGWMLLSFCGGYVVNSGTLMVVENSVTKTNLGRFALAANIAILTHQVLGCFSAVTSPSTYKHIAVKDYRSATWQVEKFLFIATSLGLIIVIILFFESSQLLHLWLDNSAPENMTLLLSAAAISAVLMVSNVPISVFLAGTGNVRGYGIAMLIAGLTVVGSVFLILHHRPEQLVLVAAIPGVIVFVKNAIMVLLYRRLFVFSPIRETGKRVLGSMCLCIFTLFLGILTSKWLAGNSIFYIGLRLIIIATPLGLFTLFLFRSKRNVQIT